MASVWNIVETVERNGPLLSVVPKNWIIGGYLYWPSYIKGHELRLLQQDASSKPTSSWMRLPCVVKRSQFLSYEEGEEAVSAMSGISATDSDTPNTMNTPKTWKSSKRNMDSLDDMRHLVKKLTTSLYNNEADESTTTTGGLACDICFLVRLEI